MLGRRSADPNQGFEGSPSAGPSQPGGGSFYLAHQRAPAMVVAIAFDRRRAGGHARRRRGQGTLAAVGYEDLTAITYVAEIDRLLVVADAKDVLLVLRTDGSVQRDVPIPGKQQEGIAVDGAGQRLDRRRQGQVRPEARRRPGAPRGGHGAREPPAAPDGRGTGCGSPARLTYPRFARARLRARCACARTGPPAPSPRRGSLVLGAAPPPRTGGMGASGRRASASGAATSG